MQRRGWDPIDCSSQSPHWQFAPAQPRIVVANLRRDANGATVSIAMLHLPKSQLQRANAAICCIFVTPDMRPWRSVSERADAGAQCIDQLPAVGEVLFLDVENPAKAALFQRQHVDPVVDRLGAG